MISKGSVPVGIDPTGASDVTLVTFLPLSTRNCVVCLGLVKDWLVYPSVCASDKFVMENKMSDEGTCTNSFIAFL